MSRDVLHALYLEVIQNPEKNINSLEKMVSISKDKFKYNALIVTTETFKDILPSYKISTKKQTPTPKTNNSTKKIKSISKSSTSNNKKPNTLLSASVIARRRYEEKLLELYGIFTSYLFKLAKPSKKRVKEQTSEKEKELVSIFCLCHLLDSCSEFNFSDQIFESIADFLLRNKRVLSPETNNLNNIKKVSEKVDKTLMKLISNSVKSLVKAVSRGGPLSINISKIIANRVVKHHFVVPKSFFIILGHFEREKAILGDIEDALSVKERKKDGKKDKSKSKLVLMADDNDKTILNLLEEFFAKFTKKNEHLSVVVSECIIKKNFRAEINPDKTESLIKTTRRVCLEENPPVSKFAAFNVLCSLILSRKGDIAYDIEDVLEKLILIIPSAKENKIPILLVLECAERAVKFINPDLDKDDKMKCSLIKSLKQLSKKVKKINKKVIEHKIKTLFPDLKKQRTDG